MMARVTNLQYEGLVTTVNTLSPERSLDPALAAWPWLTTPRAADELTWLYAPGDYPASVIGRLVREGRAASRFVEFVENYATPRPVIHLRCTSAGPQRVFAPSGGVSARPGTRIVDLGSGWVEVSAAGAVTVGIEVAPQGGGAATVGVDARHGASWEVSVDGNRWVAPDGRPGGLTPADMAGEPTVPVEAAHVAEDLWRFPSMVLGVVEIEAASRPTLVLGESLEELDSPAPQELRFELEATGEGRWQTVHEVSGRHVRVSGSEARAVRIRARSRPHPGAGSFACSDPALTDIWHASALTLHLCMQGLVVDGLKRDRMPWSGDQALNTTSNAFAFGDGAIVRDGLIALGRPTHGYVNGISDYSLWWLVNAWQYVLYFGDEGFASEYADHIDGFVARLAAAADGDGLFAPPPQADGFVGSGEGSVFIDWGFAVPDSGPSGALQILWFWALASAVSLLESAHHPSAPSWRGLKDNLERTLRERAWDAAAQRWRTVVGEADGLATAHPNLFAVLSGLDEHPTDAVRAAVLDGEVGTPFMRAFALLALARSGLAREAVVEVGERWSRMLDRGPGTMWEEFDGPEPWAMYGRPFAKSLCHAWASGPAALLPEILVGLRPSAPGWRSVTIDPDLAGLDWAAARVPTPLGELEVFADRSEVSGSIPAGMTAHVIGREIVGPDRFRVPRTV